MNDINNIKKQFSGIYFLIPSNNKKVYIGKSINVVGRIKQHKTEILNKTHYNKNLLKFEVEKTHCILVPCFSIDNYERYYINLFSKLKLSNLVIPSYNGELNYIDVDNYIIRHKLKSTGKKLINTFIFNNYISRNKKVNINNIKNNLIKYVEVVNTIGKIKSMEYSFLTKLFYFKFYNNNYTLVVSKDIKKISNLKNIDINSAYQNKELQRKLKIRVVLQE